MSDSEQVFDSQELTDEQQEWLLKEREYQDQIEVLKKENLNLSTQFKQFDTFIEKLNKSSKEIGDLKSENSTLRSQLQDVTHRLELTVEASKQLQSEWDQERQHIEQVRNNEYADMNENFNKKKEEYEQQIKNLNQQIDQLQETISQGETQAKLVKFKNERLFQTAGRYFDSQFSNIDELIKQLESTPQDGAQLTQQLLTQKSPSRSISLTPTRSPRAVQPIIQGIDEQTYQRAKNKNKKLKVKCADLQSQLENLEDEAKKQKQADQKEIKALKEQIETVKEEQEKERQSSGKQINSMQAQIDSLKEQLQNSKNQTEILAPITRGLPSNSQIQDQQQSKVYGQPPINTQSTIDPQQQSQIQELQERQAKEIESLQKEVRTRLQQAEQRIAEATKKEEALSQNIDELNAERKQLASENSTLQLKINSLQTLNSQMEDQISTLRNALHAKQPVEEPPKPTLPPPNYKQDLKKLKDENENLNKKLIEQQIISNSSANKIEELNKEINAQTKRAEDAEEKSRQLAIDLRESENKIKNTPKPNPNDLLPSEAWHSPGWSSDLASSIDRIASNQSLQPASKLQHVFNEIQHHYNDRLNKYQGQLNDSNKEAQNLRSKIEEFVVDTSIALTDSSISFDEFMKTDAGKKIVSQISTLRHNFDDLKVQNDQQLAVIDHLIDSFEFEQDYDPQSINNQIDDIKSRIELQTRQFENTRKKARQYKQSLEELNQNVKRQISEFQEENQKLVDENEELNKQLAKVKSQYKESRELAENLQSEIEQTLTERDLSAINTKDETDKEIASIHEEYQNRELSLQQEIQKANQNLQIVTQQLEEEEKKTQELEQLVDESQNQNVALQSKLDETVAANAKQLQEAEERHESEKETLKKEYDNTIQTLQTQYKAINSDLEKVAQQLSQSETKAKSLRQQVHKLQEEKQHSAEEKKRILAQVEREKLLIDAQARTRIIDEQAQMNEKLMEQQFKHEDEKKKLFNIFADKFHQFYNPMKTLDEREFKAGVERCYEEFNRLNESDKNVRKLLGAQDKQTTEDAVAQILVSRK